MESNGEIESSLSRSSSGGEDRRVGLIFDERMCKHYAPAEEDHPECPDRILAIWSLLNSSGLAKRSLLFTPKSILYFFTCAWSLFSVGCCLFLICVYLLWNSY